MPFLFDLKTMPYQLYVYVDGSTSDDAKSELDDALFMELLDSNIDATLLDVDADAGKPGMHLLKDVTLDDYPAAIMVSPKGYQHRFDLGGGDLEAQLNSLTQSPLLSASRWSFLASTTSKTVAAIRISTIKGSQMLQLTCVRKSVS